MGRASTVKLCQKLKTEATGRQDDSAVNKLRLSILDFFLTRNVSDDIFEEVLRARINDDDPAKEQSKVICVEILQAWQASQGDRT